MNTFDEVFQKIFCYHCFRITDVSGSAPEVNIVCKCGKKNYEFFNSMTERQKLVCIELNRRVFPK